MIFHADKHFGLIVPEDLHNILKDVWSLLTYTWAE